MPYGTIKIDTITFTDAGVDKSIAVSGLVQNPTFTGNVTVTGTVSGATVRATTVSGVTVSGTTANFASGVFTTQISGAIHVAPAGTAGAPSVQIGTGASIAPGLYSPATDQLGISTGGSFRLVVDSIGRVGIGTANPTELLQLSADTDPKIHFVDVGNITAKIGIVGSTALGFEMAGSERLRIDSSGCVGVGMTPDNQAYRLQIYNSSQDVAAISLGNNVSGSGALNGLIIVQNQSDTQILNRENGYLSIATNNTERLRIDSSGRVGIGTSSPGAILHTTATSAGAATIGAYLQNSSLTAGTEVRLAFAPNTNLVSDNRYSWIGALNVAGSNDSALTFATAPGGAPGTERMRIDSNGFANHTGAIGRGAPVTKTGNFTVGIAENWLICNGTASITVTLPTASAWTGREIMLKTIAAFTVVSASSNVVPLAGGAASTAILAATTGKYATLVSDGTNWIIMQAN